MNSVYVVKGHAVLTLKGLKELRQRETDPETIRRLDLLIRQREERARATLAKFQTQPRRPDG